MNEISQYFDWNQMFSQELGQGWTFGTKTEIPRVSDQCVFLVPNVSFVPPPCLRRQPRKYRRIHVPFLACATVAIDTDKWTCSSVPWFGCRRFRVKKMWHCPRKWYLFFHIRLGWFARSWIEHVNFAVGILFQHVRFKNSFLLDPNE
jgi:hypothetical protein